MGSRPFIDHNCYIKSIGFMNSAYIMIPFIYHFHCFTVNFPASRMLSFGMKGFEWNVYFFYSNYRITYLKKNSWNDFQLFDYIWPNEIIYQLGPPAYMEWHIKIEIEYKVTLFEFRRLWIRNKLDTNNEFFIRFNVVAPELEHGPKYDFTAVCVSVWLLCGFKSIQLTFSELVHENW